MNSPIFCQMRETRIWAFLTFPPSPSGDVDGTESIKSANFYRNWPAENRNCFRLRTLAS